MSRQNVRLFASVGMAVAVVFFSMPRKSAPAEGSQEPESGIVRSRVVRVEPNRLVAILGGDATEPDKVFALPMERFLALARSPDSGVQVEESAVRLRGRRLRVDHVGSQGASYVLVDLDSSAMWWVHPKEKAYVEWRKPVGTAKSPTPLPQLETLEQTSTINGFTARAFRLQTSDGTALVWIAQEPRGLRTVLASFGELQQAVKPVPESLDQLALRLGMGSGVPVRVQVLTPKGYTVHEIVAFEQKSWPADEFSVPAGWKAVPVERAHESAEGKPCDSCP